MTDETKDEIFTAVVDREIKEQKTKLDETIQFIFSMYWGLHTDLGKTYYSSSHKQMEDAARLGKLAEAVRLMREARALL